MERLELRACAGLAHRGTLSRESAADLGLDTVEPADPIEGFGGDRGGLRHMDVVELAPYVRPAGRFLDPLAIKSVEARIGIGLQHSGKGRQVHLGSFAL